MTATPEGPYVLIAAVLALHAPKRLHPRPRFAPWCGACSTGQVSHFDDGSFTHSSSWPCSTVLALVPEATNYRMSVWVCDLENGCNTGPCTCPPHDEDETDDACGEDEAAWCHFCAHYDCEAPCPATTSAKAGGERG